MTFLYLSSFILIFGGGFSWFFVKMHSSSSVPLEFSIFYRQFLAGLLLIFIAKLKNAKFRITLNQFKLCLFVTVTYYIIYYYAAYKASVYLVAGLVSFISSTKVLFAESFLALKENRRPSGRIIVASLFGIFGISIMSKANMDISNISLHNMILGLSIALLAPIGNALSNVAIGLSDSKKGLDNFVMASYCWLMSAFFFLIVALIKYKTIIFFPIEKSYIIPLIYLSFFASGITMVCVYYLIEKIGSVATTYMSLAHSPVAMLLAVLFQGYHFEYRTAIGLSLCLFSLYISNTYSLRKARYKKISDERKERYSKN